MRIDYGKELTHIAFDTASEVCAAKPDPRNAEASRGLVDRVKNGTLSWIGCEGENFFDYIRYGWPDGHRDMMKLAVEHQNIVAPLANVPRKRLLRDRQGQEYDIHTANFGRFDKAWTRRMRSNKQRPPRVCVAIEIAANACMTNKDMFGGPAMGLLLADALVRSRMQVMILAIGCSEGSFESLKTQHVCLSSTVMKQYTEHINTLKLSGLCLSGWFRYHGFNAKYCTKYRVVPHVGYTLYRKRSYDNDKNEQWQRIEDCLLEYHKTDRLIFVPHRPTDHVSEDLRAAVQKISASNSNVLTV